ncbi:hypothetical protein [Devosia sp. CN2-171]|uniref:hypothetical protein n=1 Tax=Devosia sp. CN2-171 TaxID=3400909 RepID=UPI003BF87472
MLQQIVSLWIGDRLGLIERLSLTSFVAQGHPIALYTYGPVAGVPQGVEVRDAEAVLPRTMADANRYSNGSYALFSNMFRMELQRRSLGMWVDADVVCWRPITVDGPFVAGHESDRFLNGAILKLAPDSPMLVDWLDTAASGRVPRWLPFHRAPKALLRQLTGQRIEPAELPHGTFGPKSITALAEVHGLWAAAQPIDVFYPLRPRQAELLWDPSLKLADVVTERTLTIHLWNEKLKPFRNVPPPPGSMMAELMARYGVTTG